MLLSLYNVVNSRFKKKNLFLKVMQKKIIKVLIKSHSNEEYYICTPAK